MSSNIKKDDFFASLDSASKAKQIFTAYYFGSYLSIINNFFKKYHIRSRVLYLDFFAGPGKTGDGLELTPLKVIDAFSSCDYLLNNCFLYFNDINEAKLLKENIDAKVNGLGLPIRYCVDSRDSKCINIDSLIKNEVLS